MADEAQQSMSKVEVPMDLVEQILQDLYFTPEAQPDYLSLSSASLACSLWRAPAQRLLFHEAIFSSAPHNQQGFENFKTTVCGPSDNSQRLASYVRRLHIRVCPSNYLIGEGAAISDFVDLVSHCHHLYELSLGIVGVHAFDSETIDALRTAHERSRPTCIRALSLLTFDVMSPILYQLLSVWPAIRYLRLGTEIAALPPTLPANVQLYELVLWRVPRPKIVAWLLTGSKGTLRILDCHTAPDEQYKDALAEHYENLISFRISRHTLTLPALLRKCMKLKELVILQPSSFLPLGDLPGTLEHLSFRHFGATQIPLTPFISAIDKLPKLRLVSCDALATSLDDFEALREACKKHGAMLSNNVLPFVPIKGPIVSVKVFYAIESESEYSAAQTV